MCVGPTGRGNIQHCTLAGSDLVNLEKIDIQNIVIGSNMILRPDNKRSIFGYFEPCLVNFPPKFPKRIYKHPKKIFVKNVKMGIKKHQI